MTLRQKIEKVIDDYIPTFSFGTNDLIKIEMVDKIMNEISKEVYGKPMIKE